MRHAPCGYCPPARKSHFLGNLRRIRKQFPTLNVGADAHIGPPGTTAFAIASRGNRQLDGRTGPSAPTNAHSETVRPIDFHTSNICRSTTFPAQKLSAPPEGRFDYGLCNDKTQKWNESFFRRETLFRIPAPLFSPFFSGKTEKNGPPEARHAVPMYDAERIQQGLYSPLNFAAAAAGPSEIRHSAASAACASAVSITGRSLFGTVPSTQSARS